MYTRRDNRKPACDECKRRKVRCSSEPQCRNCTRDRKRCVYSSPSANISALQRQLDQQQQVIERLTRVLSSRDSHEAGSQRPELDNTIDEDEHASPDHPASVARWKEHERDANGSCIGGIEQGNAADLEFDESRDEYENRPSAVSRPKDSGYTGPQSGAAALNFLQTLPSGANFRLTEATAIPTSAARVLSNAEDDYRSSTVQSRMIDLYFESFHPTYALLHEGIFRARVAGAVAKPKDGSWPLVFNIVLAMGALSGNSSGSIIDQDYYKAARESISLSVLEKGSLDYIQGLMIMAKYLQMRDKPNAGFALIGVAWSMAMAVGLHREFGTCSTPPFNMENRRRTWWAIYCLVSDAQLTFGRPPASLIGVNVQLPTNVDDSKLSVDMESLPSPETSFTTTSSLIAESRLAMLTNSVQALLLSTPDPPSGPINRLDQKLCEWDKDLANLTHEGIPEHLDFPRTILLWRSYNLKLILNRPRLFSTIATKASLRTDDKCIQRCLKSAHRSVDSICAAFAGRNSIKRGVAWYATHYLITAGFVLAVCFAYAPTHNDAHTWKGKLEQAVVMLARLGLNEEGASRAHRMLSKLIETVSLEAQENEGNNSWSAPSADTWCAFMDAAVNFQSAEGIEMADVRLENSSFGLGRVADPLWPWYADSNTGSIGLNGEYPPLMDGQDSWWH